MRRGYKERLGRRSFSAPSFTKTSRSLLRHRIHQYTAKYRVIILEPRGNSVCLSSPPFNPIRWTISLTMLFRKELALLLLIMVSQVLSTLPLTKITRCNTCGHPVMAIQVKRTDRRDFSEWCTVCADPRMKVGSSLKLDAPEYFRGHCDKCHDFTTHRRTVIGDYWPSWWKCTDCDNWLHAFGG